VLARGSAGLAVDVAAKPAVVLLPARHQARCPGAPLSLPYKTRGAGTDTFDRPGTGGDFLHVHSGREIFRHTLSFSSSGFGTSARRLSRVVGYRPVDPLGGPPVSRRSLEPAHLAGAHRNTPT